MDDLVHGHCDERFHAIRDALSDALACTEETGAAIAVDIDGELVVDMWGGYADAGRTKPWTQDTIVNVWSSTKTVTALAGLMLIDRGLITAGTPVAECWPEFGANGKQDIEFRHLLTHSSGLSGWEQPFAIEDSYDWEKSTAALAGQAPWWQPGTASGYHALTYGHLIGEVLRRITGMSLKEFVREEISGPLAADFQIGARREDAHRIAEIIPSDEPMDLPLEQLSETAIKTLMGAPPPVVANTDEWRAADIGAVNGHGNARSLARILSAISLGGTVNGVKLLQPETVESIFEVHCDGPDVVLLGHPLRWGLGFGLPQTKTVPYVPDGKICFWGGWGGSWETCNPDHRATFAYVMNRMGPGVEGSARTSRYLNLFYEALA